MRTARRIGIAFIVLLVARVLPGQQGSSAPRGVMEGIVTDTNLVPLAGATVSLLGTRISAKTGENGRFRVLALPAGEYVVFAQRLGYSTSSASLQIVGGDTLRPSLALERVFPELDTVRTTAAWLPGRLKEFEERRARKIGYFITEAEIERRNGAMLSDVLRGIPSITVLSKRLGEQVVFSTRTINPCAFQIFVDGMIFNENGDLSRAPSSKEIAGIEVYAGPASIPLEYKRHDTMCGVMLIWTRSGK